MECMIGWVWWETNYVTVNKGHLKMLKSRDKTTYTEWFTIKWKKESIVYTVLRPQRRVIRNNRSSNRMKNGQSHRMDEWCFECVHLRDLRSFCTWYEGSKSGHNVINTWFSIKYTSINNSETATVNNITVSKWNHHLSERRVYCWKAWYPAQMVTNGGGNIHLVRLTKNRTTTSRPANIISPLALELWP